VVDPIYKFVVDKFFIWSYLEPQIFALSSHVLRFEFLNFQTISDGDTIYTKVVVLDELQNFVAKTFLIKINYSVAKKFTTSQHLFSRKGRIVKSNRFLVGRTKHCWQLSW